jgi:hypothetical protein
LRSKEGEEQAGTILFESKKLMNISDQNMDESFLWKISHRNIPGGSYEASLSRNGEIIRSQPFQNSTFNYHRFLDVPFEALGGAKIVSFRYQELSEKFVVQESEISEVEPENKTDLFSPHNFDRLPFHQTCKPNLSHYKITFKSAIRKRTIPGHQS